MGLGVVDGRNRSALQGSAPQKHFHMAKLLFGYGDCDEWGDSDGCTALYYAIDLGHEEVVRILLREGRLM